MDAPNNVVGLQIPVSGRPHAVGVPGRALQARATVRQRFQKELPLAADKEVVQMDAIFLNDARHSGDYNLVVRTFSKESARNLAQTLFVVKGTWNDLSYATRQMVQTRVA